VWVSSSLIAEYNIILYVGIDYWTFSPTKYISLTLIGTIGLIINYFVFNKKTNEKEI
jgi:hypothetical protein